MTDLSRLEGRAHPLISPSQSCRPGRRAACPWARAQQVTAAGMHLKRTVCVSRNWRCS